MNKEEFEQTSFYQAMAYECDSGPEDEFEDRPVMLAPPKPKPKPRPVLRNRHISVEVVNRASPPRYPRSPNRASPTRGTHSPSALPPPRDTRSPSALPPPRTRSPSALPPFRDLRSPSAFAPGSPAPVQDEDDDHPEEEFVRPYSDDYMNHDFGLGPAGDQEDEADPDRDARRKVRAMFSDDDEPHEDAYNGQQRGGYVELDEVEQDNPPTDNADVHGADNGGTNGEDCRHDHAAPHDNFDVLLADMKQDIDDMVQHNNDQVSKVTFQLVGAAGAQSAAQSSPSGSRAASVAPQDAAKALLQALGLGGANAEDEARMMATLLKQAAKLRGPKKGTRKSIRTR